MREEDAVLERVESGTWLRLGSDHLLRWGKVKRRKMLMGEGETGGSQRECVSMGVGVYVGPRGGRGEGGHIPEAMHDCCGPRCAHVESAPRAKGEITSCRGEGPRPESQMRGKDNVENTRSWNIEHSDTSRQVGQIPAWGPPGVLARHVRSANGVEQLERKWEE